MPPEDTVVTHNRQTYSNAMLFAIPPEILVEQLQKQLHETRMRVNEEYQDVTLSNEMISFVVEIIHDGVKRPVGPIANATIHSISIDDNGMGTIEVVD
jgi:hypothetical protein